MKGVLLKKKIEQNQMVNILNSEKKRRKKEKTKTGNNSSRNLPSNKGEKSACGS